MTMHVAFWPHTTNKNIASYRLRCMHVIKGLRDKGLDVRMFDGIDIPKKLILSKRYDKKSLEKALELKRKYGTKIYLDICDNHFFFTDRSDLAAKRAQQLRIAISQVDGVIVSSEYLQGIVAKEVPSAKFINVIGDIIEEPYIPSLFDGLMHPVHYLRYQRLRLLLNKKSGEKNTRLVWFGNHSGGFAEGGLDSILEVLPSLNAINVKTPITLTIISNSRSHYKKISKFCNLSTFYLPWNKFYFSLALQLHGIAIIPIQKNPFTLAKTSNRVATSLVHGLDVVADSIPSYQEFKEYIYLDNWDNSLLNLLTKTSDKEKKLIHSVNLENNKIVDKWQECLE